VSTADSPGPAPLDTLAPGPGILLRDAIDRIGDGQSGAIITASRLLPGGRVLDTLTVHLQGRALRVKVQFLPEDW
jgi:hypothetical protein